MKEPLALTWEEQLRLFENRGMKVSDNDIEKLKNISYYRLKEFARPLSVLDDNGNICYNGIEFKEVLTRYYQDKNLRMYLLHAIEKIEVATKTKIADVLGNYYGAFGYLDFSRWSNRSKYTKFQIEKEQLSIKKRLLQISRKKQSPELKNNQNLDRDGFPSVWLGIDLLMFGDVTKILELMSDNKLKLISSDFGCTNDEFISWMKCLNFIRNICAHNSNLIDIKLTTKPKIRKDWEKYLYYKKNTYGKSVPKPSDRLAVVIIIVVQLVNKINSKYSWKRIQKSIQNICKNNENRAFLLGFKSLKIANEVTDLV